MWKWFCKDGEFIPGIPAGDLTDEEMDEYEARSPGLKKSGKWKHEQASASAKADTKGGPE